MTWLDSIYDLQYYNQSKNIPCYCEALAFPSDLQLHGALLPNGTNYSLSVYTYSADGQTEYEDATSYFEYYIGKISATNHHFFNARLKSYAPSMCVHACYILRVVITAELGGQQQTVFDKYTERYCQTDCCDVAKNISISQDGYAGGNIIAGGDHNNPIMSGGNPLGIGTSGTVIPSAPAQPRSESACGAPVLRLISQFDCLDNFTGEYYGKPDVTLAGSADFTYVKVTTFKGQLKRNPRTIERTLSYNCRLQKVESTQQFLLEGFEFFPEWKMVEIESQLHAPYLYLDNNVTTSKYNYAGDEAFSLVSKCVELYKLQATLEFCKQQQIFGCGEDCGALPVNYDGSNALFIIPGAYQGGGFYSDQKEYIAHDYAGLLDYMRTRNGVTDVMETDISTLDTNLYKVFGVKSQANIPTVIYYDSPVAKNKIYATQVSDEELLKLKETAYCETPVAETFTIAEATCLKPVFGVWTLSAQVSEELVITGYGNWTIDAAATNASLYEDQITLSIKVTNSVLVQELEDEPVPVVDQIIGYISSKGWPSTYVVLTHEQNSSIPEYAALTIDNNGEIRYIGNATTATETLSAIQLSNLTYKI